MVPRCTQAPLQQVVPASAPAQASVRLQVRVAGSQTPDWQVDGLPGHDASVQH
jgi:hypothetical protein